MYNYIVYDPNTGMIRSWLTDKKLVSEGNIMALSKPLDANKMLYVVDGALVRRPEMPLPEKTNTTVGQVVELGLLPEGSSVYIDKKAVGITDTAETELSFPISGVYNVRIIPPFPYVEKVMEVVVNEANT